MAAVHTSSILERSVLKEGQLFLVTDRAGDIRALNVEGHGLYYQDTRFMSLFEVDVRGTQLALLSSVGELNFMSNLQFTNETTIEAADEDTSPAAPRTISIRRNRFLKDGLHERLGIFNYNRHQVRLELRFTVGSDFRDMFDVRGYAHATADQRGDLMPPVALTDGVVLAYRGKDGTERRTLITFTPRPASVEVTNQRLTPMRSAMLVPGISGRGDPRMEQLALPPSAAVTFNIMIPPMEFRAITIHVSPESDVTHEKAPPAIVHSLDDAFVEMRDSYEVWDRACTTLESDNEMFDQLIRRARQDLRLLTDDYGPDGGLVPSAGIPWFAVPFGRDSLITAIQTLPLRSDIAVGTLRFLAKYQGVEINPFRDEEPGKILHEIRLGELAKLGAVPHNPYYGSIDATPFFLIALGEYVNWTGDLALARELLPNAKRALEWLDQHGDRDGDGFVEYESRSPRGIRNQGWKDSSNAICHRDGATAPLPVALVEVQAYAFAARSHMARLFDALGETEDARRQRLAAESLRRQFLGAFAMEDEDGPYWALALDGEKRRAESITSNPGHALWAGLLRGNEARLTVDRLMAEDMLSGWGVRTLSDKSGAFNPISYHNGSVWPHDNALLALGMKRSGADAAALEVATQVFEAGLRFPTYRLPELFCGFARDRRYHSMPAQYPVSCSPQAWAAGSVFMLLQALLGLEPDALDGTVRIRPSLPMWLGRISVRKLRVAGRRLDFDVFREGHRVRVDVIDADGLQVEVRDAREA